MTEQIQVPFNPYKGLTLDQLFSLSPQEIVDFAEAYLSYGEDLTQDPDIIEALNNSLNYNIFAPLDDLE